MKKCARCHKEMPGYKVYYCSDKCQGKAARQRKLMEAMKSPAKRRTAL